MEDPTMRRVLAVSMALVTLATAARLSAQQAEMPKPGPEHQQFKEEEGTYEATLKVMGGEFKGKATFKVGLGGLWLMEHFTAEFGGMPFEGRGATTYDPAKKKYINVWIDSMVTRPMVTEGTYDKATKTLTLKGKMPLPDGKETNVTMTSVRKDADNHVFTLNATQADGTPFEMQISYKRISK
jgi:hypothetical protein